MQILPKRGLQAGDTPKFPLASQLTLGFLYWLGVLLTLEPGNAWRTAMAGYTVQFDQEIIRILAASLLGSISTPVVFVLIHFFPIPKERWHIDAMIHASCAAALAAVLIVSSCIVARWLLAEELLPIATDIKSQLLENWALLFFCIGGLIAAIIATIRSGVASAEHASEQWLAEIPVKMRKGTKFVPIDEIDWFEAQGNYVAIHAGTETHLIRNTLAHVFRNLSPARFVRIHRGAVIARAQVAEIQSVSGGDTLLRLKNGQVIRASRTYRANINELINTKAIAPPIKSKD